MESLKELLWMVAVRNRPALGLVEAMTLDMYQRFLESCCLSQLQQQKVYRYYEVPSAESC